MPGMGIGSTSTTGGGGRSSADIQRTQVKKLTRQVSGQETKLARIQGKPLSLPKELETKKKKPSAIGRIFDVLSRGQYASAAVAGGLFDKDSGSVAEEGIGALKNLWGGLSGKKKASYSQVLEGAGVKNKWVKGIGGFIGDVALDPTTYVGAGLVKTAGGQSIKAAGKAEDIIKGLRASGALKTTQAIGKEADALARAASVAAGELKHTGAKRKGLGLPVYEATKKTERTRLLDEAQKIVDDAAGDAKIIDALDRPRLQIKLNMPFRSTGGKTLVEVPLDKPFGGASRVAQKFVNSEAGGRLAEIFSTKHLYTEKGNEIMRRMINRGAAGYEDVVKGRIRPLFKGTTKETRDVTDAGFDPKFMAELRKLTDEHWDELKDKGIVVDDNYMPDYIPTFFQEHGPAYNAFIKKRKKGKLVQKKDANGVPMLDAKGKPVMEKHMAYTVQEAKDAGLKPITDIEEIMTREHGNHVAKIAHAEMTRAIFKEMGTVIKDPNAAAWAQKNGLVKFVGESKGKERKSSHYSRLLIDELGNDLPHYYVTKQAADAMKLIDEYHLKPELVGPLLRNYDRILNASKFLMTAANPGHHLRNLQGDIFLGMQDGVVNPAVYWQSAKILKKGAKTTLKLGRGKQAVLNDVDIKDLFDLSGTKSGMIREEFARSTKGRGIHRPVERVRRIGEGREDWGRLAHFISALKEETAHLDPAILKRVSNNPNSPFSKELTEAAERAGARTRKGHVDYGDLTPAERKYMKRMIPFYTFMRKNLPLQLEAIAMRPGRVAMVPKTMSAMETLLGTKEGEREIFPHWMQQSMHVRLKGEGEGANALYWLPALPIEDVTKHFAEGTAQGFVASLMSNLTPAAKIPIEQATGKKLFGSQPPIKNQAEYWATQLPPGRVAYNLLKKAPEGQESGRLGGRRMGIDAISKYLLATGLEEVTPGEQLGELRRQQDATQYKLNAAKRKKRKKAYGG